MSTNINVVQRVFSAALVVAAASKGRMRNHAIEALREALDEAGFDWQRVQHLVRAIEARDNDGEAPAGSAGGEEQPITAQEMTEALVTMVSEGSKAAAAAATLEREGGAWG